MPTFEELLKTPVRVIREEHGAVAEFLRNHGVPPETTDAGLGGWLEGLPESFYEDIGIDRLRLLENLRAFCAERADKDRRAASVTVLGGHDKNGRPEVAEITLASGSVTAVVGVTGSGKSRLLADIEWMAQRDTPTGRAILIDGQPPDPVRRFQPEHKLVAQLSQNMNFVLDATVAEFIGMHAQARGIENTEALRAEIIRRANALSGEPFEGRTPLTALSGGQSRALMIADTAFLSASAIVLIDEIENAGIDRRQALGLLARMDKIVLIATHDPMLALMAQRRLVVAEGGVRRIVETSPAEKALLAQMEAVDRKFADLRRRLRDGESLDGAFAQDSLR